MAVALVCAKDWVHYTRQNEIRDVAKTDDGALWAAFAWGLQERLPGKSENTYMPGSNNLAAADFAQLFALPGGNIIAVSKNGTIVRKNKNSKNFEIISSSYVEGKRNVLHGLGKRAEKILILPFENALAFFDYEQNRSVITLLQIGTSSLESIKRVAVRNDSLWIELNSTIWKRKIEWNKIYEDYSLINPSSWNPANTIPFAEESKPAYIAEGFSFPLEQVKAITVVSGSDVLAWGNDYNYFSKMQNENWTEAFWADQSGYHNGTDQKNYPTKSLAMLPSGDFAFGFWGVGILTYNGNFQKTGWFHSKASGCPTGYSNSASDGYTIVQGLVPALDYSGYVFSYFSEANYGLGFVDNYGNIQCKKSEKASSSAARSIIIRRNEIGDMETYVAWINTLYSDDGGVDLYSPEFIRKWTLPFGSPIDFAFDSKGILWAVSLTRIFYLDNNDNEWKEPSYIRGFGGGTITSLETDAQNGLWVGTDDGAYSFSQKSNSPDSLQAKQFKIKDGLLSDAINDIAIDTIKGKVYFAHNLGLSVFSTPLVRRASDYMQDDAPKPIAYPNPFRPGVHNSMKIDYINEKSSLYILDSSGKRVRLFRGDNLKGGAAVWDGKNESGKLVAPGLYYYLASDGKNMAKGKIIVER